MLAAHELKRFSVANVINKLMYDKASLFDNDNFEYRVSQLERNEDIIHLGNIFIPNQIISRAIDTLDGSPLIGEEIRPDLTNLDDIKQLMLEIGIKFVTPNKKGNVIIPDINTESIPTWYPENGSPTQTEAEFGSSITSPKTIGSWLKTTNLYRKQIGEIGAQLIVKELSNAIDAKILLNLFEGSGSANEILGLLNHPSVNEISGASLDRGTLIEAVKKTKLATNKRNLVFVCSPATEELLATRLSEAGGDRYLIEDLRINKYPVVTFNKLTDNILYFGNFENLLYIDWGNGLDLLYDPYSEQRNNIANFYGYKYVDTALTKASSFVRIIDIT